MEPATLARPSPCIVQEQPEDEELAAPVIVPVLPPDPKPPEPEGLVAPPAAEPPLPEPPEPISCPPEPRPPEEAP
ncbi:MAG: hypothetical protein ABSB49_20200 [Polyangia bacterium]